LFSGESHRDYDRYGKELDVIFATFFPEWTDRRYRRKVLPLAEIPRSTITRWWRNWAKNHGLHKRKFTDDQEAQIKETIISQYIMRGRLFTERTFRVVALQAWKDFGHDEADFKCSNKFIDGFKDRNHLSSRRFHAKRRDPKASKDDIAAWVAQIQALLEDNAHNLVVNCDETAWMVIPSGLLTWAPVGADGVTVNINANDKECVTVLASITAAGNKLPLLAIAQGKTTKVEETQLGSDETMVCAHSKSGWTTIKTFRQYLDWLAMYYEDEIAAGYWIQLILDLYPVHRSDQIKKYAKARHIRLWFIPAGFTDELQPLDRAVFGAMKAMFRRLFEEVWRGTPDKRASRLAAIQLLKEIWQTLSVNSIRKGWSIYDTSFGTADDTDADPAP
jgi:hypothetical protein